MEVAQAALEQQSIAQHQHQELVAQIVKLAAGKVDTNKTGNDHLQSRIEQLTIVT